jgi:amino acid adenylation domain-containing protein/non-ribosomal peptide synthase protein (TIGR01720 family)
LFITLLAAFQTLLYRYTGQSDISVGTPIANRTRSEVEGLIGFFVNTLVMRADLGGEPSFRELLKRVREVALGAYAHQDVPFEMLVDQLRPERDMSHSPLFQVMLVLQNAPRQAQELSAGLTLDVIEADDGTARFDLTLTMVEDAGGLSGALEYNTDLFDAATIERMVEHLQVLLAAIVAEPDRSVSELPLLTDVERRRLLADWNDTLTDYPYGLERCVHALFEAQVEQTPQATALIFEDQRLTYTELNQRANQLAHHLRKLGVGPETLVGISVERSPEMVVGLLGILKAGGAYLPIDPTYPQERIVFMLQDAQAAVLLTQQHLVERLSSPLLLTPYSLLLDAGWETIARESQENPIGVTTPENLAYVIYTSGSTGRPKGVLLRHRGLCNLVNAQTRAFGVSADSRVLQFASFSFDASVSETFMALLSGATLYLARQETLTSLPDLFQLLRELKITTVTLPPSVLKALPAEGLDDLQTLVSAGEACSPDVVARWAPGRRFFNAYGPTEATIGPALGRVEDLPQGTANVPIGRPISNTHIYVLDARSRPVAVGVPGELHVGGAGVARGYLNRPELTAVKFVPDPFSPTPGARLYRTGDRARFWADGRLEFLGRIDQQVKVRGFRIELGEIEALLSRHAALQAAVAVVRQDEAGHKRLVAYVVPAQGPAPSSSEMRAFLLEKLPEYMLPSLFVVLDALPLTPNGKVDRRVLPAPDQARPELASVYVAPRTPEEETLAGIWAQILGLEQVGVHDNFFELGGDSILSIQVIARANQAGLRLTPKELFQYPTVAGLVAVADKAPALHAEQGIVAGPLPLTPIQRWFFEQELPEPQHWNQALLLEVEQALEPWPLAATVRQLLEHHDALRLRFARDETGWEQINAGLEGDVPFTWVNLSALPPREQGRAVEATAADLQTSLDLTAGPLLRVAYFDLGVRRAGRLLMVVHHLAVDEASWPILLQDFQLAYEQLRRGRKVMLPPKTTSFQHWARNLAAYAQTEQVREELTYWLAALPGQVTLLPVDDPQGDNTEAVRLNAHDEASARSVMVSLTAEETSALLDEVPEAYRTETEDVLLTALVQAFEPWTGRRALRVHLKGHGREDILEGVDVSRTVGWFTSLFPVHLDLKAAAGLGEALQTVKEQLRQVPGGGMGYGLLRYLHANQPATLQLQALAQPEVSFGYWEQLEQFLPEPAPLRRAQESPGPDRYPGAKRSHVLDVQASIVEGQLQLEWVYSENLHRRATVERLAEGFVTALRALIAHCQSPEAGGYTLSDFADFEWSQEDFEDILAEIGRLG